MSTIISAGLFAVGLALTVYNVPDLIQSALSKELDTGWATLLGTLLAAVVGATAIGWQAKSGIKSLRESREQQAELDRAARAHQHQLDRDAAKYQAQLQREYDQELFQRERQALLSVLRGELLGYANFIMNCHYLHSTQSIYFEGAANQGLKEASFVVNLDYQFPAYASSLDRLGHLGASIAADLARVCRSMTAPAAAVPTASDTKFDPRFVSKMHAAFAEALRKQHEDVVHVAMRLQAIEYGQPDPGSLLDRDIAKRKSEQGTKG